MPKDPPSLVGRAAAAVVLTICFYTLAIALAVLLIGGPLAIWALSGPFNVWATLAMLLAGVTVLRAIAPKRLRFEAPGPRVTRSEQPELFAELDAVAGALGEDLPAEVYLDMDHNAAVTDARDGRGSPRKRIMILGLPLLASVTPLQLRAIVAHEYGHYIGGDTRFSTWIWRTRLAVDRTLDLLDNENSWFQRLVVRLPFLGYATLFMRLTSSISRRSEFAADAVGARVAGAEATAEALRNSAVLGEAYDGYWRSNVEFVLERGRRPPVMSGFDRFLAVDWVRDANRDALGDLMASKAEPYDSHPTLAQRLGALGVEQTEDIRPPAFADSAVALLRDLDRLERQALTACFGAEQIQHHASMHWDELSSMYVTDVREVAAKCGPALEGATVGQAADLVREPLRYREAVRRTLEEGTYEVGNEHLDEYTRWIVYRLTVAALERNGWALETSPGTPLICTRGGVQLDVGDELKQVADDETKVEAWRTRCAELAVADLSLAPQREAQPGKSTPKPVTAAA